MPVTKLLSIRWKSPFHTLWCWSWDSENHTSILPAAPCLALSSGALGEVFTLEGRRDLSLPSCFLVTSCLFPVWLLSTVCDFLSSSWWLPVYFLCDFCLLVCGFLSSSWCVCVCVCSVTSNSLQLHGQQPTRPLCSWDVTGKNTGVGCRFLLQGIFLTQGSNPGLFPTVPPGKPWDFLLLTLTTRVPSWSIWIHIRAGTQNFEKGHGLTAVCLLSGWSEADPVSIRNKVGY